MTLKQGNWDRLYMNDKYEKASTLMPGPISKEWDINKVRRKGKASRNVIFSDMLTCDSGKNIIVIPYICEVPIIPKVPGVVNIITGAKGKDPTKTINCFTFFDLLYGEQVGYFPPIKPVAIQKTTGKIQKAAVKQASKDRKNGKKVPQVSEARGRMTLEK